jgi:glycosyltransferase involved in cell wall biosynthesis
MPDLKRLSIPVHYCPLGRNLWENARFVRRFSAILRSGRYQVVHCHGRLLMGLFAVLAKRLGVSVIVHAHSTAATPLGPIFAPIHHLLRRLILRCADAGLACSSVAADAIFGLGWRSDARFQVLHCAINPDPFTWPVDRVRLRSELGLPADALVVGHVGNFTPLKNYRFLIDLACEAVHRDARIYFLLVGKGVGRADVGARIRAEGIEDRVLLMGVRRDVPLLMRAAMDVMVLPSISEGLPMTLIEAQAAGLPCVVSSAVCRESEIAPGRLNFLPLAAGLDAWVNRVFELLKAPRLEYDEAIRQLKDTDFVIAKSATALGEIYSRMVSGAEAQASDI